MPKARRTVMGTQFGGGLNGGETAFAHLYVRLAIEACLSRAVSCSVLFLDVIAAFAQMLRRIVFDCEAGDEAWYKQLSLAGFSDSDIQSIIEYISAYRLRDMPHQIVLAWIIGCLNSGMRMDGFHRSTCLMSYMSLGVAVPALPYPI